MSLLITNIFKPFSEQYVIKNALLLTTNYSLMRIAIILLTAILYAGCANNKSEPTDSDAFLAGKIVSELKEKQLGEVSGLAASMGNPGLLWTHNDSGNPAEVYLIDQDLTIRLTCKLKGVRNRDWEDIAVGPGPEPGKNYVYVGDIGDNNARYPIKYIYRFEEPVAGDVPDKITITAFDTIAFRLSGETKDTEAILIDPETKDLYIFSKREKPIYGYVLKFPYANKDKVAVAEPAVTLPLTQIVAADISADGKEILLKNYDNIYYWRVDGKSIADALKQKPAILKYSAEPQGEAITFSRDGSGFYTLSEKISGEKTYLYFYKRSQR